MQIISEYISVVHGYSTYLFNRHFQFYSIRVESDLVSMKPIGMFLSDLRRVHTWSIFGKRFCSIYHYPRGGPENLDPKAYLSIIDMTSTEAGASVMHTESRFHLTAVSLLSSIFYHSLIRYSRHLFLTMNLAISQ
jgi:hypothetical protein